MKKKILCLLLTLALCFGFGACGEKQNTETAQGGTNGGFEKYSNVFYDAFDTVISITAYCRSREEFDEISDYCRQEFNRYHKLYDIYNSYDGVTGMMDVNEKAASDPVKVDSDIIKLLQYSKDVCEKTGGRVNIAMGAVLLHWHNAREAYNDGYEGSDMFPLIETLQAAAEHCSIDDIVIDEANSTVSYSDPMLRLDVGAVAKGYATERVAEDLKKMGVKYALINAGGNVRTIGTKPGGDSWRIGIQNPEISGRESYVETLSVADMSVVTSGVYERFFTYKEKRYHHIIDPDTLFPEDRYQSVSIVTEKSDLADALSTAVFNIELEQGKALVNSMDGVEAMWILNDGSYVFSDNFEQYIVE